MLFSSITFLYYFLPLVLLLYFLTPRRGKNLVLLFSSLFFYFWGEPIYVLLMLASTFSGWIFGFGIDKHRGTPRAKTFMALSLAVGFGLLAVFKYSDFFLESINLVLTPGTAHSPIPLLGLALPIGISFYTFQIHSYTIDLYRGEAQLQRNFFDFATYVTLFPQLIAGPIVRYTTVAEELENRRHSLTDISSGVTRFILGLGKKVLLANVLGELAQLYRDGTEQTVLFTWLYLVAYAFHIYFDFSGYSDMAIGLGRIFGFHFLENFNYPYISKSVTEFWRRWHMSLGSWFRDYVYIPLGGNKVSGPRWIFNILLVWFLTGFWHGAGWTFIFWGLYFGALLLLEKFVLARLYEKLPKLLPRLLTLFFILLGWAFFDAPSIGIAFERIGLLFGAGHVPLSGELSLYYLRSYLVPLLLALVGSTPLPARAMAQLAESRQGEKLLLVLRPLFLGALLLVITAYLIDGSFNPFIYFRF